MMQYNLYAYLFQDAFDEVWQFRIDLREKMVMRFILNEYMFPVRSAIFMFDVEDLPAALSQITRYLVSREVRTGVHAEASTDALVAELLHHFQQQCDFLLLFGDTIKYDDQSGVADFLLQIGYQDLVTVPGNRYLLKDFVHP